MKINLEIIHFTEGVFYVCVWSEVKVAQLCPTLCDPMDYTVHGILQARILEWVAIPFSRGSSQPRDWTQVSCIADRFFTSWTTKEAHVYVHVCVCMSVCSVVSDCLWPHARLLCPWLLCPWDFLGKNSGVACHFLLQEIFLTQELNPHLLQLLHRQVDTLPLEPQGKPVCHSVCVHACVCVAHMS